MQTGEKSLPKLDLYKVGAYFLRFLFGTVLCAARMFGGYVPFAVGFFAASGGEWEGVAALCGGFFGAWLFLDFTHGLRAVAIGTLLFAANHAFAGQKFTQKPLYLPLLTATLHLAVEFVYVFGGNTTPSACFFSAGISALCAFWYRAALSRASHGKGIGTLMLLVSALTALASFTFANGFSPGRIAAVLLTLLLAFDCDGATAAIGGLGVGLCMDCLASETTFFHTALYAVGALAASRQRSGSRMKAGLAYLLPLAILTLPLGPAQGVVTLCESTAAVLMFLLLPQKWFAGRRIAARAKETEPSGFAAMKNRMEQAAAALRELYDSVSRAEPRPPENPNVIFTRTADKLCCKCAMKDICWMRDYDRTQTALNDAIGQLLSSGEGTGAEFPSYFVDRCAQFPRFLQSVNAELNAYRLRREHRTNEDKARAYAAASYARATTILRAAAESEENVVHREMRMTYQLGSALCPKAGETISGDSLSSFQTDTGALCIALADGMGSGDAAKRESSLAVRLLERFLKSGISPELSLRTLSGALAVRQEQGNGFTTLDLLHLSLHNGDATLYKYGAAPSYLKSGGRVRRITCSCLPIGLQGENTAPEATPLYLSDGMIFVMVTDGVADESDDEWLQNLLAGWSGTDPQSLAAAILASSYEHKGASDDRGAVVLALREDTAQKV